MCRRLLSRCFLVSAQEFFEEYDRAGDGALTFADFNSAVREGARQGRGRAPNRSDLRAAFESLESGQGGGVGIDELCATLLKHLPGDGTDGVARTLMAFYEAKHPEFANEEKIQRIIESFKQKAEGGKASWQSLMWEEFDKQGVNPREFAKEGDGVEMEQKSPNAGRFAAFKAGKTSPGSKSPKGSPSPTKKKKSGFSSGRAKISFLKSMSDSDSDSDSLSSLSDFDFSDLSDMSDSDSSDGGKKKKKKKDKKKDKKKKDKKKKKKKGK